MAISHVHSLANLVVRIALGIEYAGDHFCGWQNQLHLRTVQGCVEEALSNVANHPVTVICAGRTDTGVHALEQVIHADVEVHRTRRSWVFGTNSYLPKDISVLWACPVDTHFHARFSAKARHYRYIILNRSTRPAVAAKRVVWAYKPLDIKPMQAAARTLVGTHDFSSYRSTACQAKNPIRTIFNLAVSRVDEQVIIDVSANAFLHHMVRNIAGVLMAIGYGEQPVSWAWTVLMAQDRAAGGITAPACGLYLRTIEYPKPYTLGNSKV